MVYRYFNLIKVYNCCNNKISKKYIEEIIWKVKI